MATYRGTDGVVKIGTTAVGEVQSFDLSVSNTPINDNVMGDEWDTHLIGRSSWSGNISCLTDDNDAGQEDLVIGTDIAVKLYPEDEVSTRLSLTGNATVTGIQWNNNHDNTAATVSFAFTGNGALTRGAVTP